MVVRRGLHFHFIYRIRRKYRHLGKIVRKHRDNGVPVCWMIVEWCVKTTGKVERLYNRNAILVEHRIKAHAACKQQKRSRKFCNFIEANFRHANETANDNVLPIGRRGFKRAAAKCSRARDAFCRRNAERKPRERIHQVDGWTFL